MRAAKVICALGIVFLAALIVPSPALAQSEDCNIVLGNPGGTLGGYSFYDNYNGAFGLYSNHNAQDFWSPDGTIRPFEVFAGFDGNIIRHESLFSSGGVIEIRNSNCPQVVVQYVHMDWETISHLRVGQEVEKGQSLGIANGSGSLSNGPHLHLKLFVNGSPVDPLLYMERGIPEQAQQDRVNVTQSQSQQSEVDSDSNTNSSNTPQLPFDGTGSVVGQADPEPSFSLGINRPTTMLGVIGFYMTFAIPLFVLGGILLLSRMERYANEIEEGKPRFTVRTKIFLIRIKYALIILGGKEAKKSEYNRAINNLLNPEEPYLSSFRTRVIRKPWYLKRSRLLILSWILSMVGLFFLAFLLVYQPVAPRPETIQMGHAVIVSEIPQTIGQPEVWTALCAEVGYDDCDLLQAFWQRGQVPRGPDGMPLSAEEGGEIFPWNVAAAIPAGETNKSLWSNPDPRLSGPWGSYHGYALAPSYFGRSLAEVLAGTQMSSMAAACRAGLKAVASNSYVQAKYPGLTAESMYTSQGCAIGRGQTLAVHFRPGALLGDLENKDVWSNNEVAAEVVYVHLVARYSTRCGANESWYHNGNVEAALCAYNPGAWGIEQYNWYWDTLRQNAAAIKEATTILSDGALVTFGQTTAEQAMTAYLVGPGRPTLGSGPFAIWETIPSLTLRLVREHMPENEAKTWFVNLMVMFGQFAYSETNAQNLGFYPMEVQGKP